MKTKSKPEITNYRRHGLHSLFGARARSAFLLSTALAAASPAVAGPFAVTSFNPFSQTVNVGTATSVDLVFAVGSYSTYGIDAQIGFDPNVLQVLSVNNGATSPFSNVSINTFNNTAGTLQFSATGGTVTNYTLTAATLVFTPIAPGFSPIDILNVNQFITGYGAFGVNGAAVDGSITVVGSAPISAPVSTPDTPVTSVLVGGALFLLGALRRRFVCA